MFTGIVESLAVIKDIQKEDTNLRFVVEAPFVNELKVDQSVSHNGVCLTVDTILGELYTVAAVAETLEKTTLGDWKIGQKVNVERGMKMTDRLDGHLVQGHVDTVVKCTEILNKEGSVDMTFTFPESFAALLIEKGSICLDGVSLTVFNVTNTTFTVTIIPYTIEHTNLQFIKEGDRLNVEFDVIGKYILRQESLK